MERGEDGTEGRGKKEQEREMGVVKREEDGERRRKRDRSGKSRGRKNGKGGRIGRRGRWRKRERKE